MKNPMSLTAQRSRQTKRAVIEAGNSVNIRYGVNFGCPDIPEHWRQRFARVKRMRVDVAIVTPGDPTYRTTQATLLATLQGLCFTSGDAESMRITADNTHRYIWMVKRDMAFAIYVW
jgi:hypothetical protein